MADNKVPQSPVFPLGTQWPIEKRKVGYESDATALVRKLRENPAILEDQRIAWERWRNDPDRLNSK